MGPWWFEFVDVVRDDIADAGRERVEDPKPFCWIPAEYDVAWNFGGAILEPGGAGARRGNSPARSANVFLFSVLGGGGNMLVGRALLTEAESSESFLGDAVLLG